MNRILLALMLAVSLSATAAAAPVTLTINEAVSLFNGLGALEGQDRVIGEGDTAKVVKQPYSLSAGVRLVIARNMAKLKEVVDTFQAVRQDRFKELAGEDGKIDEKSPEAAKFTKEIGDLLQQEQSVDLVAMKSEDLDLKTNAIPASVLVLLAPILTDFDTASVPDAAPPAPDTGKRGAPDKE